jgi:outer membrane protein TolC
MRKIGRFILITVLNFILIQSAYTQEKLVLTLEKSLQIALAQNPYHLAAGERVESAESKLREAVAGFLPVLNGQGIATLDEKLFAMEFPSFIPGQPPQKVEVDFTRDYQFALSFSLPLFTGGRLRSGFRSAKYNLQASKEAVRQSTHITVFNTKRAFYGCLLAGEFINVAREAVDVAEKHLHNVKTMYEVGMASKFDLLRAEVQVSNLKPQLIKAKNSLKIGELSLKTILGLDLERAVEITGELKFNSIEPDLQDSLDKAIRLRPELTQLNFKKKPNSISKRRWQGKC